MQTGLGPSTKMQLPVAVGVTPSGKLDRNFSFPGALDVRDLAKIYFHISSFFHVCFCAACRGPSGINDVFCKLIRVQPRLRLHPCAMHLHPVGVLCCIPGVLSSTRFGKFQIGTVPHVLLVRVFLLQSLKLPIMVDGLCRGGKGVICRGEKSAGVSNLPPGNGLLDRKPTQHTEHVDIFGSQSKNTNAKHLIANQRSTLSTCIYVGSRSKRRKIV